MANSLNDLGEISIHAPARGATDCGFNFGVIECISIHAPARGATNSFSLKDVCRKISIHAPARGATAEVA